MLAVLLGSAVGGCSSSVWIDFPPELDRGSAIVAFETATAVYAFAIPASTPSLRLPSELTPAADLRIEALIYERSLAELGLVEGRQRAPEVEGAGGPLPQWKAAYGIDVRGGEAEGKGRGWASITSLGSDVSALRLPFSCPDSPTPTGTELPSGRGVEGSVAAGSWTYYEIDTTGLDARLTVELTGGLGDADLYVVQGDLPNQCNFTCRSENADTEPERCEVNEPGDGKWFVGVRGVATGGFTLKATRHGRWGDCQWVGVEDAGLNSHQSTGTWCGEGTFMTQFAQTSNIGYQGPDSPTIGSAKCCTSGDMSAGGWTPCDWSLVEQAQISSLEPGAPWCPAGTFITQFNLDGGVTAAEGPVIGAARCCGLANTSTTSYHDCTWVPVDDSHAKEPSWCPEGAFLTQFDLDGCGDDHRCPVVGQARCCRPRR